MSIERGVVRRRGAEDGEPTAAAAAVDVAARAR